MIAIVLSMNMRKLLAENVLVRRLLGIETAGSLEVLFTDKTGTITEGVFNPEFFLSGSRRLDKNIKTIPSSMASLLTVGQRLPARLQHLSPSSSNLPFCFSPAIRCRLALTKKCNFCICSSTRVLLFCNHHDRGRRVFRACVFGRWQFNRSRTTPVAVKQGQ